MLAQGNSKILSCHAILKIPALKNKPINALLSDAACQAQNTVRHVSELMFSSVLFLGKKGVAFSGGSSRGGILYELMQRENFPRFAS